MEKNLDYIPRLLYMLIRQSFPQPKLYDEEEKPIAGKEDIPKARTFSIEYKEAGAVLGVITINLSNSDGIKVSYPKALKDRTSNNNKILQFLKTLKNFAISNVLRFGVDILGDTKSHKTMNTFMNESKLYGTSKTSYQDLNGARIVIQHTAPVAENRTQHIHAIYIENNNGERFKYPKKYLNGARALAEHIRNGGTPYDQIGEHIIELAEELVQLRKFNSFVTRRAQLAENIGTTTQKVAERINEVRKQILSLQRPGYYKQFAESFTTKQKTTVPDYIIDEWTNKLTIKQFNEELKSAFPYIYNIIDENDIPVKNLSVDDFFEFAQKPVSSGIFSNNIQTKMAAVNELNELLAEPIQAGPDGINAIHSLKDIINDEEFLDSLESMGDLDVRSVIVDYILEKEPSLANVIQFNKDAVETEPEPVENEPPEPEPELDDDQEEPELDDDQEEPELDDDQEESELDDSQLAEWGRSRKRSSVSSLIRKKLNTNRRLKKSRRASMMECQEFDHIKMLVDRMNGKTGE